MVERRQAKEVRESNAQIVVRAAVQVPPIAGPTTAKTVAPSRREATTQPIRKEFLPMRVFHPLVPDQ
jgi:hypothetical protein